MGPAAVLPVAEAAALLPLGDTDARDWLTSRGLVLALRGREVVIWGDVLDAIRQHRGLMSDHTEGAVVEGVLTLLCDLTRPESRDAVARLVAEAVGLKCGATAPGWRQTTGSLGGWVIVAGPRARDAHEFVTRAPHQARGNLPSRGVTLATALLGVIDPAEALARIAVQVLGAADAS